MLRIFREKNDITINNNKLKKTFMKKLKLLLVAVMAMVGASVYAVDYVIDQRFTSIEALSGQKFAIVNETDAMAFYGSTAQNLGYSDFATAFATTNTATSWRLVAASGDGVEGYYYLQSVKPNGTDYSFNNSGGYLNAQPTDWGWCCFILGLNNQNGQDFLNGAVWDLEVSDGKFAIKNIGTGLYLKNAGNANNADPTYFTFCTLADLDELKADYNSLKPLVEALDDDATIFTGDATVDISAAETAFANATTLANFKDAIAELRQAAVTFVTSVTVNEGKFFDLTNIFIVNPTVRQNTTGWTAEGTPNGGYSWGVCNYNECEFYQQNFDFYQTLTLPRGTYEFGVTGFHRAGNHATYFYAGEDKILIPGVESSVVNSMQAAEQYFNNGNGKVALKFALEDESNTMKIGIVNNDTQTDKWTIFRDFTLHYFGSVCDYSIYQEEWDQLVANAGTAMTENSNVTGTELADLIAAIADAPDGSSKANYLEKIGALEAALSTFNNAISSYNAFAAEKAHAETLGVTEFPSAATAAEAAAAVNSLKVSEHNAVISKYTTDGSALFIPTWDKENFDAMSNEHWSGETREYFDKNGTNFTSRIYKEVTLPEGHYVFYAAARGATNAYANVTVTIDGVKTEVPITMKGNRGYGINTSGAADFSSSGTYACNNAGYGWEWRHIAFDLDEGKTVTIAIECGAGSSWAWVSAGDTRLVTYDNIAVSKNRYETALAAAIAARDNAEYVNITGSERTNLEAAIDAPTPTTREEYDAAAEALEEALPVFTAAKGSYDRYAAYKAETVAAFGSDLGVAAPTTAAEAAVAVQSLNIAQYNKVATDYTFSCSGLIGDFGSWTGTATVAGEAAEPNYLNSEHWSGDIHAYYEQAGNGWGNAAGWTIQYQKTCTLPAGDYVIKVAARSSGGTTSLVSCSATDVTVTLPNLGSPGRGIATNGVASWSDSDTFVIGNNNDTDPAVGGQGLGWQWRFLPFTLTEQTEVTMTFYAEATTQYQWMSIADGELLSKTNLAEDVAYNEANTNVIEDKLIADVTMSRTIKAGFNTVVLPFTLTVNQVTTAFGTGTEVYNYSEDSDDATRATVNFNKGDGSINANTPVLVKATVASSSQRFEGVQIVAAEEAKVVGTNFDFVGTYAPIAIIPAGDYFIGNGALYKSTGATSMNAFRAYITANRSGARIAKFFIDGVEGEATAIEGLEVVGADNGKIYNLNGQEVKATKKGLYIQNGKKVVVK